MEKLKALLKIRQSELLRDRNFELITSLVFKCLKGYYTEIPNYFPPSQEQSQRKKYTYWTCKWKDFTFTQRNNC